LDCATLWHFSSRHAQKAAEGCRTPRRLVISFASVPEQFFHPLPRGIFA
jgi:hypothetical protein